MMPGSKGLNPHELAHRWVKDLGTRPDMSIKVGYISHDMRILGRIVGVRSTEQSAGIIVGGFCPQHHITILVQVLILQDLLFLSFRTSTHKATDYLYPRQFRYNTL